VSYYGTRISDNLDLVPACPLQFHLGERDASIPPERVAQFKEACPTGDFHLYPAGHGFNCTDRADYDADSARRAFERTLAFFGQHLG
jgi:carboxymethylenebutenolidase